MTSERLPDPLRGQPFVAVLRRLEVDAAIDIARRLVEADLRVIEVTMDSNHAITIIKALQDLDCIVGAGTVRNPDHVISATGAGARFLVSPVFDREVLAASRSHAVTYIPGCFTPTEIARAEEAGVQAVKLFPASSHGPESIKSLRGPFPNIGIVVTGGISADQAEAYWKAGADQVGIGVKAESLTSTIEGVTATLHHLEPPRYERMHS